MKHLMATVVLLTLIITGSLLSIRYTNKTASQMMQLLESCEVAAEEENWTVARKSIEEVGVLWNECKPYLALYQHHTDLEGINDLLTKVTAIVKIEDKKLYEMENKRLVALVDDMSDMDILTFENLF